jgi:hypothetical protein
MVCGVSSAERDDTGTGGAQLSEWALLGEAVRERRVRLGLAQDGLALRGGPSELTVRKIERGHPGPYRGMTLAGLETALGWPTGTVRAILDGTAGDARQFWTWTEPVAATSVEPEEPPVPESVHRTDPAIGQLAGELFALLARQPRTPATVATMRAIAHLLAEDNGCPDNGGG